MKETHRYSSHNPQTFLQYDILFLSILDLDVFLANGATGTIDYIIVDYYTSLWIIIIVDYMDYYSRCKGWMSIGVSSRRKKTS